MEQATREGVLRLALERYGAQPEYPWADDAESCVLRQANNRKWFGLLMHVPRAKLGLAGEEPVWVLNVKCDPILAGSLRRSPGYLPAYHMSKERWLTVLLDGTVPMESAAQLLDLSYELTMPKPRAKKTKTAARRP